MTDPLEFRIARAKREFLRAKTRGERRLRWEEYRALLLSRSDERRREMEVKKFGRSLSE